MSAMTDLRKAGIHRDTDLIKFPWERAGIDLGDQPTIDQVNQLRELMRRENEEREKQLQYTGDTSEPGMADQEQSISLN